MPVNRPDTRETMMHQIAVLVAYHRLSTTTAYDLLKASGYNMSRAIGMIDDARSAGKTVKDFIAEQVSQ